MRRPSKYRAVPTVVDGVRFASKKEARRFQELKLLEKAGEIVELELQPVYRLLVNGVSVGKYVGDFQYYEVGDQGALRLVLEDCKGFRTPAYQLKAKLIKAQYGIEIRET